MFLPPPGFLTVQPITARSAIVARDGRSFFAKRVASRYRDDAEAREMLAREGRILTALEGSGATVPTILEGEDRGGPFLVTGLAPGNTLAAQPVGSAGAGKQELTAALRALQAVHGAHDRAGPLDVVHGDLSPDNLLVVAAPRAADRTPVTVVDFELAAYRDGGPPHDGAFRGTLPFAAPESVREGRISVRSDLFALGAIFFGRLTGVPARRQSGPALILEVAEHPVDLGPLAALPPELSRALGRLLAFDPLARPASAEEVLDDLV